MQQKAVGYARVSTYGQMKEGYSLVYQVEEIERYCQQHNLKLVEIYEDKGLSGATVDEEELTIEREGLQDMLGDLSSREIQYVVVLNTSRLWRSDMAKVLIQRELKRHHMDVKSVEQPTYSVHTQDPNDFLVNGMLELLDQYQRLEIALKLSRGRKKKAKLAVMPVVVSHTVINPTREQNRWKSIGRMPLSFSGCLNYGSCFLTGL